MSLKRLGKLQFSTLIFAYNCNVYLNNKKGIFVILIVSFLKNLDNRGFIAIC